MHFSILPLALALRAAIAAPSSPSSSPIPSPSPSPSPTDDWHFGHMFELGPPSDNIYITKATYVLVPPAVPCGWSEKNTTDEPWLSLWVGLSDSVSNQKSDLYQPLLNWSPDQEAQGCSTSNKEWCVATSTYQMSGQVQQPYIPVPQHSELEFAITVDNGANKINQQVSINGKEVSHQADNKTINPTYIYSSNECYQNACGTLSSYSWKNMTIHLSAADINFQNTIAMHGARDSGITTPDNGKTWHINSMRIDRDYFYQDGDEHECETGSGS